MRKILVPAAAAALLALAPLAATARTVGYIDSATVQSVNPSALTVTLSDGSVFNLARASQLDRLKPGDHIAFNWQDSNGSYVITRLSRAI